MAIVEILDLKIKFKQKNKIHPFATKLWEADWREECQLPISEYDMVCLFMRFIFYCTDTVVAETQLKHLHEHLDKVSEVFWWH